LNFLDIFSKNTHISKLNENPSNGSHSGDGQTDRQTDMTKLTVAFHNFANAPIKLIAASSIISPLQL